MATVDGVAAQHVIAAAVTTVAAAQLLEAHYAPLIGGKEENCCCWGWNPGSDWFAGLMALPDCQSDSE